MVQAKGNTTTLAKSEKLRISPSRKWCGVHNNFEEIDIENMVQQFLSKDMMYVIGREVGENGTPHLQFYVEHKTKKFRPMEYFKLEYKPHYEKCKGTQEQNIEYCTKENNYLTNFNIKKNIKVEEPYGWQLDALKILEEEPEERKIHWWYEPKGKVGKSQFCKYMCVKKNAVVVSGKGNDILYMVAKMEVAPKIILIDIPRCVEHVSYNAIEKLKDGLFFSAKYESTMYVMNTPTIMVFANEMPQMEKLSDDRWNIVEIGRDQRLEEERKKIQEEYDMYSQW